MAVRPEELQTPERGMDLTNRGHAGGDPDDDALFRQRIAAARRMVPPDVGCRACWQHGKDTALTVICEAEDIRSGMETARTITPHGSELHWLACWVRGRDAAIAAVAGE